MPTTSQCVDFGIKLKQQILNICVYNAHNSSYHVYVFILSLHFGINERKKLQKRIKN